MRLLSTGPLYGKLVRTSDENPDNYVVCVHVCSTTSWFAASFITTCICVPKGLPTIMWGAKLESFLFLFTLKSCIAVGNAYPTSGSDVEPAKNNIMNLINDATPSVTSYSCVYIPSNLDLCRFGSKSTENLWNPKHKLSVNKKRKLLENNKMYFTSRPSMRVPGTKKFQSQPFVKTIIYEIQTCAPPRLPFVLPWCTDEDLTDKQSEIHKLYPFMINGFPKGTYVFPTMLPSKELERNQHNL
ncbi:uncharacterized protein LOC143896550 isoform X1 [Temnothorax americanus]|uniref:uncharacterized protein LOC143896550 isoform X1 n=1 Tax=Temnothorax americanus TaxID=1964332 RepID=UPI004067DDD5